VFRYVAAQHDPTNKTVFGTTGHLNGDDVIDLAYRQKAAATFLPRELAKFYLSEMPLPSEHLAALGELWRTNGFDLRTLAQRFFGSRLFFAPEFRGNFIKSPVQFYLGALQNLQLDVTPLPRFTLNPLRQMGQALFAPPNVRGWVGGRNWINSATLSARRQWVEWVFAPLDENSLNADEQIELVAARSNGARDFVVSDSAVGSFRAADAERTALKLASSLGSLPDAPEVVLPIREFLAAAGPGENQQLRRIRRAAVTLMQSPDYQLC